MTEEDAVDAGKGILSTIANKVIKPIKGIISRSKPVDPAELTEEYDFKHERRGMAIIFNNEYFQEYPGDVRDGSRQDAANLTAVLVLHGFDVHCYNNQTAQQMFNILQEAARQDHSNADCFFCAVMSHGYETLDDGINPDTKVREDVVNGTDIGLLTRDIVEKFQDDKCPTLQGKPRFFVIQACRGSNLDDGVPLTISKNTTDAIGSPDQYEVTPSPIYKDFLILYATPPGYYAFRRPATGSWLIQALSSVLVQPYARTTELRTLLTKTIRFVTLKSSSSDDPAIGGKKQTPCFCSMLTKDVYFRTTGSSN